MSNRDRILLMWLPAAVILFIYGVFIAKPKYNALDELDRQARGLEAHLSDHPEQLTVRRELAGLRAELASLQKLRSGTEALGQVVPPEVSLEANVFFEALLAKHKMIVINEKSATSQDARGFSKILSRSPGEALWKIELAANYSNVAAFLYELGRTELPLTPVGVDMVANYQIDTDLRLWNLWIYR
ncbi:MAG: hypothetical protein AAF546_14230 [Verrucomicrobiota bacterium]